MPFVYRKSMHRKTTTSNSHKDVQAVSGFAGANGFTYLEVLISSALLLTALLFTGRANMTSLNLIARGKINQRATLLLLDTIERLRSVAIQELVTGDHEESSGSFLIQWKIQEHTPYFGTKQVRCRVVYVPASSIVVESLFYRSE